MASKSVTNQVLKPLTTGLAQQDWTALTQRARLPLLWCTHLPNAPGLAAAEHVSNRHLSQGARLSAARANRLADTPKRSE